MASQPPRGKPPKRFRAAAAALRGDAPPPPPTASSVLDRDLGDAAARAWRREAEARAAAARRRRRILGDHAGGRRGARPGLGGGRPARDRGGLAARRARRLQTSVADPSVPGRVRTSAVAVGANLSGCAFVGEVNLGATMDMDVVSDALNHGALAAEAYRPLADEANRPPRCGVYVNGSVGLGRYAVAAHVYDAVDGKGAYYGDAPLRLAPRDLTVDGADRAFATPFHVDPDLDVSGLVKVVPTNNSLIISALGQILTELELSNVTFVFDESQEDWGGGWDDVDAYLLDSWGVVATKLTTEELVADVAVVDASHLLVVASYDPDSCEAEMDALDAGRLAPQAQLFVSCLDGLFAKEIVRGFAGQTERSYAGQEKSPEVGAGDRVEAVDGLTGESAARSWIGWASYDLDWDPLSSETAVYALAALSATLQALEGSLASTDADDLNARLLAWLADQPAVATALGNLTFDASGQASVAREPVSQYTAEAEKKLVCNAGDCQGDGTCACRDGFSGDECAVKNCAPGSYYTAPSGKTPTDPPVCETCEPGTFTDAYGSDKCRICDLYSYAPDAGASSCLSCPANSKRYPPSAIDLAALASFDGDAIFEFLISHATSASHCICEMGTCEGKHCCQPLGEDGVASKCDFTECAEPIAGTGAYSPAAAVFDGAMTTVDVSRKKLLTWEHPLRMDRCASYEGDCQGNYNCPGSKAQGSLLCQATRAGFTTVGDMVIECPAGATGVVFQLLLSGGLVAAFFVVTHFSDKYEAVGIFLTHARSISIIAQVDVNWPKDPLLALFFNFMAATQFDVDIAPPRCFFAKWGFMERILVQLLLLLFMFGFYFFFSYLPTWYRHRGSGPELVRTAWNHLLKFCIASLVMTYPSLCEVSIASMICKEFDDGGAYLAQDLEMRRQHRVVASLGFVMTPFLIGFPLWIYAVLVTKIKRNELMSTDSLERYGPMYSGFKPHIAWWSAVEIAKQLTLEALNQILRPLGPGITLWAYVLIQFIHVVSMAAYDPFLHAGEKGLQSALLSTAVVVIASASLFAYYGDEPSRHEEQHMLTVSYIVDGCLIVCLYITYSVLADKPKPKRASLLDKMNDLKRPSIKTLADVRNSLEAVVKGDDNTGNYFADPDSEFYQTFCSECFLKWVDQADPKDPKTKELLEDILYVNEHLLEAYCRDDAEFGTYAAGS
ncbi:hypothetical protein JL721_4022 [Aureococcus anophagefferens]|nr:hypothetical protein JL721_4022 [Aureococcus anophagefferens]